MSESADRIADPAALAALAERAAQAPWLALDTEFIREKTYYPQLCLLQIAGPDFAAVVDTLAVPDLGPLLAVLGDGREKVLHAAGQDLEVLYRAGAPRLLPLFDTQVAAGLLGIGDQLGYAALVERRLGLTVDKSLTRTDWSRRPLRDAEYDYAAADVIHLAALYPALRAELEQRSRLAWLQEDAALAADPGRQQPRPDLAWRSVGGLGRLDDAARARGARLAAWREREAVRSDRPRKWILADDLLLALAQHNPQDRAALERIEGMPPKLAARHGTDLIEVLAASGDAPPPPPGPLTPQEKARFETLRTRLRALATSLDLPPSMLANRNDLEALARDPQAAVALRRGWRAQFLPQLLEDGSAAG